MPGFPDTIAAVATPAGRGGIGIVRLSGADSLAIARSIGGLEPQPRQAHYTAFRDAAGGAIDRGLLLYFPSPASYTGEDVVELHGHGGLSLPRLVLARVIELGARHARPGEFTERAFLNDKLDLVQAEAVADLVDSGSARAARSAMRSLEGVFSRRIGAVLESLIAIRVYVEGSLDFPDEELELIDQGGIQQRLHDCLATVQELLAGAGRGRILRAGLRLVILGRPNVGKSSLLNQLSRSERAIVTGVPGTTRDLVEDQVMLDGLCVNLVDTAGIRETPDSIEKEGIQRALKAARTADILLVINDVTESQQFDLDLLREHAGDDKQVIIINNKIDLRQTGASAGLDAGGRTVINLSAATGAGVELLVQHLEALAGEDPAADEHVILARERHIEALQRAARGLRAGLERLREHQSLELLAEDLRQAQHALGEITGAVSADDLLGEIFSRFCIGK